MISHATPTPTQMALHEARKQRQARQAQMASRVQSNDNERLRVAVREPEAPEWSIKPTRFDAHVSDRMLHLAKVSTPKRAYVFDRIKSLGFTVDEIMARTRRTPIVRARQAIILEVKELWPETSMQELGRLFGGYDHTTVLNALTRAKQARAAGVSLKKVGSAPKPDQTDKPKQARRKPSIYRITEEQQDQIVILWRDEGLTYAEICRRLCVPDKAPRRTIQRRGITR